MEYGRRGLLAVIAGKQIVAVGAEELNCFRGGDTTRKLAMMGGCVYMALYDLGLYPNWINTSTIKGRLGAMPNSTENKALIKSEGWGKQAAAKRLMIMRVNELKGLNLCFNSNKAKSDDDTADAVAVGDTLLSMLREGTF